MKLTDPIIKAAKPKEKPYSLPDGHGLVLLMQPSGAKWWRYRYRFNATAKMLSMGVYPELMCQHFTGHKVKQHFSATRNQRGIHIH